VATASDLVERQFRRDDPDRLWVTDITEHPTREGKRYCAVDVFSRRVVGWSIDSNQETSLVTSALGMAIANRDRLTTRSFAATRERKVNSHLGPSLSE
jgi:putative transposase